MLAGRNILEPGSPRTFYFLRGNRNSEIYLKSHNSVRIGIQISGLAVQYAFTWDVIFVCVIKQCNISKKLDILEKKSIIKTFQ